MNQTEQTLLLAIRKALWNQQVDFPSDTDWDAVLKEAEEQSILGIVASAAPDAAREKRKSRISAVTAAFIRILHAQSELYRILKENAITMVILKGTASAIYYTNPSQRSMGDIDFLVPIEQFDRAKELLTQNGYVVDEESGVKRHIHLQKNGIIFEQHWRFSSYDFDIERFVLQGMENPEVHTILGAAFPMLPALENGLVLLAHLVQHLRSGLGLRQVIDWMMYVDKELNDEAWNRAFRKAVREAGLETTAVTVTKMCQMYLGLNPGIKWPESADPELCSLLIENLLESGNFGRKRGEGIKTEKVITQMKSIGFFRYLQFAGEHNWKACRKHKWLKPFAWCYQIGRYIKQGIQMRKRKDGILLDVDRGEQRAVLLKRLKIQDRSGT